MWSKSQGYLTSEQSVVSQQPIEPSVDQVVEPMRSLVNPTLPLESDLYQVIETMSSLVNPTLPSESDLHQAVESM